MHLRVIRPRGAGVRDIGALVSDTRRCHMEDFLEELRVKDKRHFARVTALLDLVRDRQSIENPNHKRLTDLDDLVELRSGDARVIGFYESNTFVCITGFQKRSKRGKRVQERYNDALQKRRAWKRQQEHR
jgi:mRNA-degrading endonuclease RelE of RelBE toxin-antitoxin system